MSVQAKPSDTAVKLQESGGIKFCPEKRALRHENIDHYRSCEKNPVTEVTGQGILSQKPYGFYTSSGSRIPSLRFQYRE